MHARPSIPSPSAASARRATLRLPVPWLGAALLAATLAGCGDGASDETGTLGAPEVSEPPPQSPLEPSSQAPEEADSQASDGSGSQGTEGSEGSASPGAVVDPSPIDPPTPITAPDATDAPAALPTSDAPLADAPGSPAADDPSLPDGAALPGLLPGRATVFGEPIASIPDPNSVTGTAHLVWRYELVGDRLAAAEFEAPEVHGRVWQRFAELVPADLRPSMIGVEFYVPSPEDVNAPYAQIVSHGSDETPGSQRDVLSVGESATVDFVADLDAGHGTSALDSLFIHEYGHVLHGRDGVTAGANDPVFAHVDGVNYRRTSPFGSYLEAFWEGEVGAFHGANRGTPDIARVVHERYPTDFVSEYAAYSPWEDFAETFRVFVETPLESGGDDVPGSDKLAWFARWPEGVATRERLRASL